MIWELSHRADQASRMIADRHYNRQKIGTPQFVPPGRCLVLRGIDCSALWVTSWPFAEYVKHDWAGAWVNSAFRREDGPLASEMIQDALRATVWRWPEIPKIDCIHCGHAVSMVTFIDTSKTKRKRDPGRCYLRAGFTRCKATTKGGLACVHINPKDLPQAEAPHGVNLGLWLPAGSGMQAG